MKHITILFFTIINLPIYSQHTAGLKVGFNNASYGKYDAVSNNLIINYRGRFIKPQIGLFYTYDLSKRSQLLFEAQYAMRGTDYQIRKNSLQETINATLRLWYVEVPFSYQVKIKQSRFSVNAGGYFGFLMKKEKANSDLQYFGLSDGETVYKDKFSPISLGIQGGFSYNLKRISFAYRLSSGLITEATFGDNFSNKYKNTASHNLFIYIPIIKR